MARVEDIERFPGSALKALGATRDLGKMEALIHMPCSSLDVLAKLKPVEENINSPEPTQESSGTKPLPPVA